MFTSSDYYVGGTVSQSGGDLLVVVTDDNGAEKALGIHVSYDSNNLDYCT
jgi:hypothetical protein